MRATLSDRNTKSGDDKTDETTTITTIITIVENHKKIQEIDMQLMVLIQNA